MMQKILQKLTSRKLWMALAGVVTGIAMTFGADSSDIGTVTGAVTTLISVVAYIIAEGKIDAEGVKNAITEVQEAVDILDGDSE